MADYFILGLAEDEANCTIGIPPNYMDAAIVRLRAGRRVEGNIPEDFQLQMSDLSDGINIPDFIDNLYGYYVVTEKAKILIEKFASVEIEFVPFKLLNHKGRVAMEKCYFVNVLGTADCVDTEKSEGELSELMKGEYDSITKLYLLEDKIPASANMFRISMMPQKLIVRDDMKSVLEKNNVTGVEFFTMGEEVSLE